MSCSSPAPLVPTHGSGWDILNGILSVPAISVTQGFSQLATKNILFLPINLLIIPSVFSQYCSLVLVYVIYIYFWLFAGMSI